MRRLVTVLGVLIAGLLVSPSAALGECDGPFPSFEHAAASARRIVIGQVIATLPGTEPMEDGRSSQFVLRGWSVLEGDRPVEIDVRDVLTQPCSGYIMARPGDRIAIAFEGHDFMPAQVVNAVAWLQGDAPPVEGIETTTIGAIYARLGRVPPSPAQAAAGSSIDWPIVVVLGLGAASALGVVMLRTPPALTLGPAHCYDAGTAVSTLTYRVLTTAGERAWRVETVAHSAPWTSALKRSFGPSSRNTSRPPSRSAARRSSSATASACPARPSAASSPSSRRPGCLTHPHTSAGRMPTDAGYRFYVESIVDTVPLPAVEQLMIRHQFGQVEFASEHWFRLAATTLAGLTRSAGLATPAKPRAAHIRRVDLVAVNERMASLILVLREGGIKQAVVDLDEAEPIDQPTLNRVAGLLNERLTDATAAARRRSSPAWPTTTRSSASRAASASGSSASSASSTPPPSRRSSATACSTSWRPRSSPRATSSAGSSRRSRTAPTSASSSGASRGRARIHVLIGAENPRAEMHDVSLVLAPYGRAGPARSAWSASSGRPG